MVNTKTFKKILSLQEKEKNAAQMAYKESVDCFESVATQFYNLLRKKEEVEQKYHYYLENTGSVTAIATHHSYIENIKTKIATIQITVDKARNDMEQKQELLTEAHIELKKYEKLIERKQMKEKERELYEENKIMDETSVRQFLNSRR